MERLLNEPALAGLVPVYGRRMVKAALADSLTALREENASFDLERTVLDVRERLTQIEAEVHPLRQVINGSGVIIHTNLGRSPIDAVVWARAGEIARGYSNLELDLTTGGRGARDEHLTRLAQRLFGAEAAILVNNNAAATLLLMAAVAARKEVVVSRGELVEVGGSFRIPEVIQQGGAKLREVGTTNKTRARDYEEAVTRRTAALLKVHRSNFEIVGFTESPSPEELVAVAQKKKIPLLVDEGSGRIVDLSPYGLSQEPTVREWLEMGADAVTCSTDKLIGATQGGLILGGREVIERCRRHPLMRALRAGKESYAIIGATLEAFLAERQETLIPIYRMMAAPRAALEERARRFAGRVIETRSVIGGGTTPSETIASVGIEVEGPPDSIAARLLAWRTPIVGRIQNDRFTLDMRTILPEEDEEVIEALGGGSPRPA